MVAVRSVSLRGGALLILVVLMWTTPGRVLGTKHASLMLLHLVSDCLCRLQLHNSQHALVTRVRIIRVLRAARRVPMRRAVPVPAR
jgi:hypothetical protein